MMPPAALAKLQAIRDTMPAAPPPRPELPRVVFREYPSGLVVLRGRGPVPSRSTQPQQSRDVEPRKRVIADRPKRREWPGPGEIAALFREEQRRHR